jgi:hypothetical protein
MTIKLKQIELPPGMSTTAVTDGQALTGTEAAELIAGVDGTNHAQFVAMETDGRVKISDGGTPLRISVPSVANAGNSTNTPLAANGVFTGAAVFVQDFAAIGVFAFANVGSATDGLKLQWSVDGVVWTETLAFTLLPSIAGSYTVGPRAAYFRLVFTNGGTAQTTLSIQTILHYTVVRTGTIRISDVTNPESDASVVKSVITGRTTQGGGGYVDVKVAPSGAVAIDGSVSVSNFPATQPVSVAALPLPAGAATEATLATRLTETTFTTRTPTLGQKTAAASSPVVLASDQPALPVSDGGGSITVDGAVSVSNFPATQPVSVAALPLPAGAATEATLATRLTETTFTTRTPTVGQKLSAASSPVVLASDQSAVPVSDGGGSITVDGAVSVSNFPATQPVSVAALPLPAGAATEATLATRLTEATFTARVPTLGQKTAAASSPVVLASDQPALNVIATAPAPPATASVASVAASITSVTIVASNTARKGATVQNDSASALYLKLGTAATTSSYTCLMAAGSYYEVPYGYTGIITGAWASATGAARVTEVS